MAVSLDVLNIPLLGWVALALALYAWTCYRSWARLAHIPGPRFWGWSVIPLFRLHLTGNIHVVFREMTRKYGPVVRLSPNMLLVADADVVRRMNAPRSTYTRAPWYVAMRLIPGIDNVFSTRDEQDHNERRRKMAAAYSGKENVSLEGDIDDCVRDLVQLIDSKYVNSPPDRITQVELSQKLQFFTTDVTSQLAFDDNFHDLRDDQDNYGYIHEMETMFPHLFCTCTVPSLLYFLTSLGVDKLLQPSTDNAAFGLAKILNITKQQVAKRFGPDGKPQIEKRDMLSSFLRHGLTKAEAEQETVLQLVAGTDTTATALRSTLLCIMSDARVSTKLVAEIGDAVQGGLVDPSKDSIISDEVARTLPYLQACIKEGLRWFPPISGLMAKQSPPDGDTLCGYPIPANVSVGYSVNAVHTSPFLFGPDEDSYRPERWLLRSEGGDEASAEKLKAMERNNELIFGWGKYQCLGKSVAAIEMNKVIFELVRRFEMVVANPLVPMISRCFGIHLQKGLWVTVRRREGGGGNGGIPLLVGGTC